MSRLKSFFKHKFVIVALCFLLAGALTLGALAIIPKSKTYTSVYDTAILGKEYKVVLSFEGDKVVTKHKFEDGKVQEISRNTYQIKDDVLYIAGAKIGKIDAYGIYNSVFKFNSKDVNTGYESIPAKYAKFAAFGLIALGGVMFCLSAYVGLTKKKKK